MCINCKDMGMIYNISVGDHNHPYLGNHMDLDTKAHDESDEVEDVKP